MVTHPKQHHTGKKGGINFPFALLVVTIKMQPFVSIQSSYIACIEGSGGEQHHLETYKWNKLQSLPEVLLNKIENV